MAASAEQQRDVVRAQAKYVHIPARKARLVMDHVRGRSVPEARTVLAFTPRAAAVDIEKVLRSAVANAEANHGMVGDDLVVVRAWVDEGPTMKRWRARARGRVARIHKRTCHITIELAEPVRRPGAHKPDSGSAVTPKRAPLRRRKQAPEAPAPEPAAEQPAPEAPAESAPAEPTAAPEPAAEAQAEPEQQASAEPEATEPDDDSAASEEN